MPKHLLENEADISKSDYNRKPMGTGPFKITDFKAGDSITLEKNTNYRFAPEKPYLDKVIFRSVPSVEVAMAQLKAGEANAVWNLTAAGRRPREDQWPHAADRSRPDRRADRDEHRPEQGIPPPEQ